jgi:single-stranded-DNA-specific exonuclease
MPLWPQQNWKQMVVGGDRQIAERFGVDPITARVLLNRGLRDEDQIRKFLHGTLEDLEDPRSMDQLEEAARLLHECILQNRKIRIIGDYDADGILSVYILYASLRQAGADVSYDIPDRFADGFGMSMRLVEKAHHDGINTIITCDNGIAQNAEISCAKQLGMTVILTDHHEPNFRILPSGEKEYLLPEADVIVDPKKPGCRYPNKNLCGASVAWKLMYLYECRYMRTGADDKDNLPPVSSCPMTMANLPFAAAATVTDLMKLTGENRILVKYG